MTRILTLVAVVLAALPVPPAHAAAPGDPDTKFGTLGETVIPPAPAKGRYDLSGGVTELPGGKLVAGGQVVRPRGVAAVVLRFRRDGTLDPKFGRGGVTEIAGLSGARSPMLAPGGGILIWGRRLSSPSESEVVRLLADGTVDRSYGAAGRAALVAPGAPFEGHAAFAQADGAVVVAGQRVVDGVGRPAAARLRPDGTLDPGFGDGGFATLLIPDRRGPLTAAAEQAGGAIVAAGELDATGPAAAQYARRDYRWSAVRLTGGGTLDPSFGTAGLAEDIFASPTTGGLTELLALPDGGLVLSGATPADGSYGPGRVAVARLRADGSLDPAFGDGGRILYTPPGGTNAREVHAAPRAGGGLALAADHTIDYASLGIASGWAIARFDAAGAIDNDFGDRGWAGYISSLFGAWPTDLLRTGDGGVVLAAASAECGRRSSTLIRFHLDDPAAAADRDLGPIVRGCTRTVRLGPQLPIEVQCPYVERECTLFVEVLVPEVRTKGQPLYAGAARTRAEGGEHQVVYVKVRSAVRRLLARHGSVRARVRLSAVDRRGNTRASRAFVTIKAPKKKR
jgi:uncharacterized delta-60 repeat protein